MSCILISGASSGIGAALARHYARPGTRLVLLGRDVPRLETVAEACRATGAETRIERLDVRGREAVAARLAALDAEMPLDLVIVAAGINGGHPEGGIETDATAFETVETNLLGALNLALPAAGLMRARRRGQIALISSLAAYAPLPDAPAYSGTKAALLAHGIALRAKLRPHGVRISVVTLGYVRTAMGSAYSGWRPFEMSAEAAADRIARGLARDKDVIAFPWLLTALARGSGLVPEWVRRAGMTGFRFRIRQAPR